MQELECHIDKIEEKFGSLNTPGCKVVIDPKNVENQLKDMIPGAFKKKYSSDQRAASDKVKSDGNKRDESEDVPISNRMPLNNEPVSIRMQPSQGAPSKKRKAEQKQPLEIEENSTPTKKPALHAN